MAATTAIININTIGNNTIIAAPGAGLMIKITSIVFVCTGAVTVTLYSGTTALTGAMSFAANGGIDFGSDLFPLTLGTNEAFIINLGGGTQVSGFAEYIVGT